MPLIPRLGNMIDWCNNEIGLDNWSWEYYTTYNRMKMTPYRYKNTLLTLIGFAASTRLTFMFNDEEHSVLFQLTWG